MKRRYKIMYTYPAVVPHPPYIQTVKRYEPGDVDPALGFNSFDKSVWDKWSKAEQILDAIYLVKDAIFLEDDDTPIGEEDD